MIKPTIGRVVWYHLPFIGRDRMSAVESWIDSIVLAVMELPNRNSPEDQPEMMLVTDAELRSILEDKCIEINLRIE